MKQSFPGLWLPSRARRTAAGVLVALGLAAVPLLGVMWTDAVPLDAGRRVLLLAVTLTTGTVALLAFSSSARLADTGDLVVRTGLRTHLVDPGAVAEARPSPLGLRLDLVDGRRVRAVALHRAVDVADLARLSRRWARVLPHGGPVAAPHPRAGAAWSDARGVDTTGSERLSA